MKFPLYLILILFCVTNEYSFGQNKIEVSNNAYTIQAPKKISKRSKVQITRLGEQSLVKTITPNFTIFYSSENPDFKRGGISEGSTPVAAWKDGKNIDFWKQGEQTVVIANSAKLLDSQTIQFTFQETSNFALTAQIHLPKGNEVPEISWKLIPKIDAWFSVVFTGMSAQKPSDLDFLYQPLVWSWKRFPVESVLTPEAFATTAASFINYEGATEGVAAHPKEIPYRFAFFKNSLFGVALRDQKGMAKPMIAAPIFGGEGSEMKAGQSHEFTLRYFVKAGDWTEGMDYLYKQVLDYRNERQNASISLNQTLENMIDFAMDDVYGGWVAELKGNDYRFDVPGTVKNVSALHPLSIALTTGNEEIYKRRALPMIEYMMSRQKYLYAVSDTIVKQNPSHFMEGPCMEVSELVSLHQLTGKQNDAFQLEFNRIFGKPRQLNLKTATGGDSWQEFLAKYRLEGKQKDLDLAVSKADEYLGLTIKEYPKDFSTNAGLKDKQATFSTDYSNRWQDLLELYEETREFRYLDAAYLGAKQFLLWTRSNPMAPNSNLLVNEGGVVPGVFPGRRYKANSYEWLEYDTSTDIPEQNVPAWRTSLVGLPPEQPYTYGIGPVMLHHQAAPLLKLAHLKEDELMRDVAYNGVIGRYANFPGYYFTSLHTTVYQQQDYPMHDYLNIKYNAVFYNHVWPHIALLQDFLVSDAYYRSGGKVHFPSAYAPGYAYLISKVYGHQSGEVFGNKNVRLWLPKNAIKIKDLKNTVPLQERVLTENANARGKGYFRESHESEALGTVTGMLIGLVPEYVDAYIYTNATEKQAKSAILHYRFGEGKWQKKVDNGYPYEFSIRNEQPEKVLEVRLEMEDMVGKTHKTKEFELKR